MSYLVLQIPYLGYLNYYQFCITQQKCKDYFCKKILNNSIYSQLYYHSIFENIENTKINGKYFDIDMDNFQIIDSSTGNLATTEAATCFVICVRGKNCDDKLLIGLFHSSHIIPLSKVISILKAQMIKKRCLQGSLEFFILGGRIVGDDPDCNSLDQMIEALNLAKKNNNIKGIRFNHSLEAKSGFQVLFTANKIYYSTKSFFDTK